MHERDYYYITVYTYEMYNPEWNKHGKIHPYLREEFKNFLYTLNITKLADAAYCEFRCNNKVNLKALMLEFWNDEAMFEIKYYDYEAIQAVKEVVPHYLIITRSGNLFVSENCPDGDDRISRIVDLDDLTVDNLDGAGFEKIEIFE